MTKILSTSPSYMAPTATPTATAGGGAGVTNATPEWALNLAKGLTAKAQEAGQNQVATLPSPPILALLALIQFTMMEYVREEGHKEGYKKGLTDAKKSSQEPQKR